ncbi:class II fructose-bisphosphate aldolase, partial [bacterium]|nr:class II fructose-bisphosphate aldolase [bacterium]
MPLVTDAAQTREIYQEARECGAAILNLNPEAPRGIEACLRAAKAVGERVGADDIPIILSVCGTYHLRPQIRYYTSLDDPLFGFDAWWASVNFYCDPDGPFGKIRAITHLDHGQPDDDTEILENLVGRLGSVMFDASTLPLEENIAATARYVERFRDQTVVEGCVDEIFDSGTGEQKNQVTTVEQATRYVTETGVDLIVPNLGTEHRASARDIHYHGDQARVLVAAVGKLLVLHGTSSLSPDDYTHLKDDGIIKVNLWTAIEKAGAQAAVRNAIENLGNIFTEEELREYIAAGTLGEGCVDPAYRDEKCFGSLYPKLDQFAECVRRDAWV